MSNEELFEYFKGKLTTKLANMITSDFCKEFMDKLERKRSSLYLQNEELAVNMAQFCNMAGKLTFPMYFDDTVPVVEYDEGFKYISDEELEFLDTIVKSGRFAIYKIEKDKSNSGMDRLKFHLYYVCENKQDTACKMLFEYDGDTLIGDEIQSKFVGTGWVRLAKDTNVENIFIPIMI